MFYDFKYHLKPKTDVKDFPIGALVNSVIYHFNIKLADKQFTGIGEKPSPFSIEDVENFKHKSKGFKFLKHKLRRVTEYYNSHRENKHYEIALKLLRMKLSAEEALGNKQEYLELLGEIADLKLEMG